ncbi:GNAT family N-acetyltransferase [Winogradskyella sp. R77965]|uniref:GNAT family N-acetyltransferase n=1 Tax=Winogradskyella sp. R77965 TaxID=3093872 RepID=UPI0037DCFE3F
MKLKHTTTNDLINILEIERNLENVEFIEPYNLERHQKVIQQKGEEHFSIFDEDSKLIGFVILAGLTNENKSIEFKRIVVSEKGKGFGSKTIELIKKKCFQDYNCNRLWLDVFDFNLRAIHVYESLGFIKEGVLRECIKTEQGFKNLIIMSILRKEYQLS